MINFHANCVQIIIALSKVPDCEDLSKLTSEWVIGSRILLRYVTVSDGL